MTDNNHTITPPPELVRRWATTSGTTYEDLSALCQSVATQAARWGADQELEACCEWLVVDDWKNVSENLRAFRRPKPPSLKEQALEALDEEHADMRIQNYRLIRSVLESLPS